MSEQTEIESPENGTVEGQKETSPGNYIYLYYYTRPEFLESILTKDGMKVSITGTGNDPLEGDFASERDWDTIDISKRSRALLKIQESKEHLREHIMMKVFCLSGTVSSPLMWGHYAAGYTGACLVFKIEKESKAFDRISVVVYRDQRIDIEDCLYEEDDSIYLNTNLAKYYACYTKISDWSYEREFRLDLTPKMLDTPNISIRDGMLFSDYLMPYLDAIVLGCRCSIPLPLIDAWLDSYSAKYQPRRGDRPKPHRIKSYLYLKNKNIIVDGYGDMPDNLYLELYQKTIVAAEAPFQCTLIPLSYNGKNESRLISNIHLPDHIHARLSAKCFAMAIIKGFKDQLPQMAQKCAQLSLCSKNQENNESDVNAIIEKLLRNNTCPHQNQQLWEEIIFLIYREMLQYVGKANS